MGYITRETAVKYIKQTIFQFYDKANNSAEKMFWTQDPNLLEEFNSKLNLLMEFSEDKKYFEELQCIPIEYLEEYFSKIKELSKLYDLPGYEVMKSSYMISKQLIQAGNEKDLEVIINELPNDEETLTVIDYILQDKPPKKTVLELKEYDSYTISSVDNKYFISVTNPDNVISVENTTKNFREMYLNPFDYVTIHKKGDIMTVPAFLLPTKAGENIIYDNHYLENIDWKSLSEEKKHNFFVGFAVHYFPIELKKTVLDNPITTAFMILVGYAIANLSVVGAACMAILGVFGTYNNVREGFSLISNSISNYKNCETTHEAKLYARECARGFALIGIELLPILIGLIKRGYAKYKNKEILLEENISQKPKNGSNITVEDIVGKKANDLIDVPDEYVLQHYVDSNSVTQTSIRRKSSEVGDYLFVDENGYIQNVKNVTKWERGNTVGSTPSKTSKIGKAVIQRMTKEGKIRKDPLTDKYLVYSEKMKDWFEINDCDMSHIEACVTYWNETGRYKGPLSPEVRKWMNTADNYYLEYYGYNRSEGAKMTEKYLPPVLKGE